MSDPLRCAGVQRFVDTYLDGEFADGERGEMERHLAECEACRAKVKAHADWKAAIQANAPREQAPAALRNRVLRQIARESGARRSWRRFATRVMPVAAAVGVAATVMVSRLSWSPMAADVVAKHQRNLPVEISGAPEQVKRWYVDKVGFPVHPPRLCSTCPLRGGRLAEFGRQQAAYLVYEVNGSKVSVFVFDRAAVPFQTAQKLVLGNREVYLDEDHGYNVALFQDQGLAYAIAGDLAKEEMLKLVTSAVTAPER